MLNCAVIMGRLVADPELRTTGSGISVTSFTVAVDRSYQKAGTERQTDFIDVVAWRQTAEFVSRYFHKGSMIAVQGSIQARSYEDKQGIKRKAVEIVADNVSFCGSKSESGTGPRNDYAAPAAAPAPAYDRNDRRGGRKGRRKVCSFCVDKVETIDYKDVPRLRKFISDRSKILPRRVTGTCAAHQRELTTAIKRARHVALLPYTSD